jgi:hypothetical protein
MRAPWDEAKALATLRDAAHYITKLLKKDACRMIARRPAHKRAACKIDPQSGRTATVKPGWSTITSNRGTVIRQPANDAVVSPGTASSVMYKLASAASSSVKVTKIPSPFPSKLSAKVLWNAAAIEIGKTKIIEGMDGQTAQFRCQESLPDDPAVLPAVAGKLGLLDARTLLAVTQFYFRLSALREAFEFRRC